MIAQTKKKEQKMLNVEDLIMEEVESDAKERYEAEEHLYIRYYPKLSRAYVEYCGDDFWLEADGISDARCQVVYAAQHQYHDDEE